MSWNWNQYKIWKFTYVHSFPCPTRKYVNCDLMHLHTTITTLLPLWHGHKCKRNRILAHAQLLTCWTAFPVWSTDNRHEIPEFYSLHWHPHMNQLQRIMIEYICMLKKIINGRLDSENVEFYLMGDMNFNMASMSDTNSRLLSDITDQYGLHQLINEPTRVTDTTSTLRDL